MANNKELVTVLTVKTDESQQTIKGLKKEIADLKKQYDSAVIGSEEFEKVSKELATAQANLKTVMADGKKTTDNVEGSYNHLTATMAELKKEWKATADEVKRNDLAQQIDAINSELKDMDASIGNFQRNVGDYTNSFKDAFEQQQKSTENVRIGLDGLQKTASGLANGYAAVQGTMALLNIESAEFEKTMIKVQSAMAIAQGIGGMKDLIEGGGTLITVFKSAVTGVKAFIKSLTGVKAAIAATGIGIFVVLLGELYANWDKITKLFKDVSGIKSTTDKMNDLKIAIDNNNKSLNTLNNDALKKYLQTLKTAKGDLEKIKQAEDELTETNLRNALSIAQQNEQNAIKLQLMAGLAVADKNNEKNMQALADANEVLTDATNKRLQAEIALEEFLLEKNNSSSNSTTATGTTTAITTTSTATSSTATSSTATTSTTEETFVRPEPQKGVLEGLSAELQIEEDMFKESRERIFQTTKEYIQKQIEEERRAAEQRRLIEEQVKTAKLDIAKNTLNSLSTIIGEQTAVGKAAAIAATTIDTYQSATAAYKAMAGIPVVGPALGAAAAAAAVISGIANVKRILSVSKDGSNASTIVNTSSPTAATPNINLAESMPVQFTRELLSDTETTNLNQAQKVYVLESDITSTQNKVEVAESNSSF